MYMNYTKNYTWYIDSGVCASISQLLIDTNDNEFEVLHQIQWHNFIGV